MRLVNKIAVIAALVFSLPVNADFRIAVLDFELHDITSNPRVPEELERTASLQSLLEQNLSAKDDYQIIPVDKTSQENATKGFGYLWDHPDEATALGKLSGAQFLVLGRVSKPSFLFVHFMAKLVDVDTGQVIDEFVVEVKGQQQNFTSKGIENLARQIDARLQRVRQTDPT